MTTTHNVKRGATVIETMTAITQYRYGTAEVLQVRAVPKPVAGLGEVLLRVKAAGLNAADHHLMTGEPTIMRLGTGFRGPRAHVRGIDVAGIVESVGHGVTEFAPGDEVFGAAQGAFAQFAISTPKRLVAKPAGVSFEHAAAAPMAGYTALQALRAKGDVTPGDRVLVTGAGGGVGSFAVQLAKHFGAHVTGVCSTGKVDLVRSLGADAVVDYTRDSLTGEFEHIIDTGGVRDLAELRSLLTPKGRLVLVGGEGGGRVFGPMRRVLRAGLTSPFTGHTLVGLFAAERRQELVELAALLESGAITPAIDRVFPLAEGPEAVRRFEQGHHAGKIVLVP